MFVSHRDKIEKIELTSEEVKGVTKQILIGPDEGWEDHVMRMFTLTDGGHAPMHTHDWPHTIYVVEGEGMLYFDGKEHRLTAGSTAYIDSNMEHQIRNWGTSHFVFLCIVPRRGDSV